MIYGIIKWGFNNKLVFLLEKCRGAAHNHIDKYYNLWYNKMGNINIVA